jgi:hypothetical protein
MQQDMENALAKASFDLLMCCARWSWRRVTGDERPMRVRSDLADAMMILADCAGRLEQ